MEPRRELTAIESALAADVARLTAENARLRNVCETVANSVALCLLAKAVPRSMRDGMQAIEDALRAALKVTL